MIKSIDDLNALLKLSSESSKNHEDLKMLTHWCKRHISSDLDVQGKSEEKYYFYFNKAKEYIEIFLNNLPDDLNSTVPIYNDLTPVQYAAYQGYNFFIDSINALDTKPYARTTSLGMSPLHFAATFGHLTSCESLLKHHPKLDTLNDNGQPPLFSALILPIANNEDLIQRKEKIFRRLQELAPEMRN